jgi:hypothetical protein
MPKRTIRHPNGTPAALMPQENDHGFQWTDPVTGESRGALVAFPPAEWAQWDGRRRAWVRLGASELSGSREVWPAMGAELPEGKVSCRQFAWAWAAGAGTAGTAAYSGARRGEVVGHAFQGSTEYGGMGAWTVKLDDDTSLEVRAPPRPATPAWLRRRER